MLAVSASRHGLLLAFWLKAMLKLLPDFSLGALVAAGTPLGAAELPGSDADASWHDAAVAAACVPCAVAPAAVMAPTANAATPAAAGMIFLCCTGPSPTLESPARGHPCA